MNNVVITYDVSWNIFDESIILFVSVQLVFK